MLGFFESNVIVSLRHRLEHHPVYRAVQDRNALRVFMEHHVYAVWDFMSLVKCLQREIAPTAVPWIPTPHPPVLRRFINALVLAEESDEGLPDDRGKRTSAAHFDLYCQAMREVAADVAAPMRFLEEVRSTGVDRALREASLPEPARRFMANTFGFIASNKAHVVAAALALGRERVIPLMFRALLRELGVAEHDAPAFHYYLKRHIDLDDATHGPMAIRLLEELCGGDPTTLREAEQAAEAALKARIRFWDDVRQALSRVEVPFAARGPACRLRGCRTNAA